MNKLLIYLIPVIILAFLGAGGYIGVMIIKFLDYDKSKKITDMKREDIINGALIGGIIGLLISVLIIVLCEMTLLIFKLIV